VTYCADGLVRGKYIFRKLIRIERKLLNPLTELPTVTALFNASAKCLQMPHPLGFFLDFLGHMFCRYHCRTLSITEKGHIQWLEIVGAVTLQKQVLGKN
jgi:hypothetical protein